MTATKKDYYSEFLRTYSGSKLLEKHQLSEEGTWEVRGEDPNCDLGGPHHEPFLGVYSGRLEDVIRMAVDLPGFWQWGGGGRIIPAGSKYRAKRVGRPETAGEAQVRAMADDPTSKKRAARTRIRELEEELAKLRAEEKAAIAEEETVLEEAKRRAAALAKLTPEERKILGLK